MPASGKLMAATAKPMMQVSRPAALPITSVADTIAGILFDMMLFPFAQLATGELQTLLSACLYYRHFNAHVKHYFIGAFPNRVYP